MCPRNFANELDRITALDLGHNYLSCDICHIALLPLPTIRVDASAGNECHGLHLFDPHLGAGLGEALGPRESADLDQRRHCLVNHFGCHPLMHIPEISSINY